MREVLYTRTPSLALLQRAQKLVDELVKDAEPRPKEISGRGIVTCGGGYTYFTNAWVLIRMLRHLGCKLPIQLWYLGPVEVSEKMKELVAEYGVECVDGLPIIQRNPNSLNKQVKMGWVLKSVALARCPFEEVMFLDSDNLPVRDPSFLFETLEYKSTGALFWPDINVFAHESLWDVFRVRPRIEPEFESGQLVVDKRRHWQAMTLAEKLNFNANTFYRLMWGDKDTFRFAWHKLKRPFAMTSFPPQALRRAGSEADMLCQHDFQGVRLFQHRIMYKWNLFGENPWIAGFFLENECRTFLGELRAVWDGRCLKRASTPKTPSALLAERELNKKVWLLEVPTPIQKQQSAGGNFFQPLWERGPVWKELRFGKNGTLQNGADKDVGYFWDLQDAPDGLKLALSTEKECKLLLKRTESGWEGHWISEGVRAETRMLELQNVYPHLRTKPAIKTDSGAARLIRRQFGREVHLRHTTAGIGDHVSAVYACTGLARTGVRVVFHTIHAEWLARVAEPGLIISGKKHSHYDHNLRYDYANEIKFGISRARWYAGGLHPQLMPANPQINRRINEQRLPFKHYVLIAPFACHRGREWLDIHWIRLSDLLRKSGFEVIAIGSKDDEARLESTFNNTQVYWVNNHPPEWIMDAMLGAFAYVGLDSGMTHLAALMGVKSVAIHSQLSPDFLWPKGNVSSITPDARCAFCRWQEEGGWTSACNKTCSALALVNPEAVLDAVLTTPVK